MRIVFLGGTRFIGHAAATLACRRGHDTLVLHRGEHRCEVPGARAVKIDRADPSALARAVAEARPDVVVDTRAMTRMDAEASALALKIAKVPVVVLSSQDVYAAFDAVHGHPAPATVATLDESAPLGIAFPYRGTSYAGAEDYDKKEVEAVFRAATDDGIPSAIVLRLPAVYGPRDDQRRFGAIVDAISDLRPLPCAGGARWRWTHADVRDVGHAIVLAAEKARAKFAVYNVGEEETPTMHARVLAIAREMGRDVTFRETDGPLPEPFRILGRAPDVVTSSAKIRAELGFAEATTEAQRMRDLVHWCRASRGASA
jgi:nucleoside-diphosphate-sugar epimerase